MKHKQLTADELKAWRTKRGFTQRAAARWLRVSLGTYRGWESGRRSARLVGTIRGMMSRGRRASGEDEPTLL